MLNDGKNESQLSYEIGTAILVAKIENYDTVYKTLRDIEK